MFDQTAIWQLVNYTYLIKKKGQAETQEYKQFSP